MQSGPQIENHASKVFGAEINDENQNANNETVAILKEKDRSRGVEELPTPQRQRIDDEPFQRNQNGSVSETLGIAIDFNHQVSMQKLKHSKATLETLLKCTQNDDVRADCKIQIGHLQAEIVAKEAQIAIDNPNTQSIQPDDFFIAQPLECIDDAGSAKDGEVPVALDSGDGGSECDAGKMDARAIRLGAPAADVLCNASPITPSESDGLIGHVDVINQGGAACLSRSEMVSCESPPSAPLFPLLPHQYRRLPNRPLQRMTRRFLSP